MNCLAGRGGCDPFEQHPESAQDLAKSLGLQHIDHRGFDEGATTVLTHAVMYGDKQLSLRCIRAGADVTVENLTTGMRPIHYAAAMAETYLVEALLNAKADPDSRTSKDRFYTPLHVVCNFTAVEMSDATVSLRHSKQTGGNPDSVIATLLRHKASIELQTDRGASALHGAASNRRETLCAQLLEAKSDPDWRNDEDQTPLHLAAEKGSVKMVKQLLEAKSHPNHEDWHGLTALDYAKQHIDIEIPQTSKRLPVARKITRLATQETEYKAVCDVLLEAGATPGEHHHRGHQGNRSCCG